MLPLLAFSSARPHAIACGAKSGHRIKGRIFKCVTYASSFVSGVTELPEGHSLNCLEYAFMVAYGVLQTYATEHFLVTS
jgi:hypothetical protein